MIHVLNCIKKSIIAGLLIGLGVIINIQTQPPLGPMLFSFGLLVIIKMQLNLYTGKIGFLTKNEESILLLTILIFNFFGITAAVGLYALANENFVSLISAAAAIKFSKSFFTLFINAFFCGILIHFAVKIKESLFTVFAIMIFILIGAEHCIADFPYLLFNFSFINLLKLITIILGNSLGAILLEKCLKMQEEKQKMIYGR